MLRARTAHALSTINSYGSTRSAYIDMTSVLRMAKPFKVWNMSCICFCGVTPQEKLVPDVQIQNWHWQTQLFWDNGCSAKTGQAYVYVLVWNAILTLGTNREKLRSHVANFAQAFILYMLCQVARLTIKNGTNNKDTQISLVRCPMYDLQFFVCCFMKSIV